MKPAVVKWQIVTTQPQESADFYQKLFGWSVNQDNALGYRQFKSAGIEGGVWPAPPGAPSFVQLWIEVDNVDSSVATAEKLGGAVIVPKAVLPDGDVMAVMRDPTGVTFGLCTTAKR